MPATAVGRVEAAVLCACARRRAQPPRLDPGTEIDWGALLRAADAHFVTEMLVEAVTSGALQAPAPTVAYLEQRVFQATALNLTRTTELVGLLQLFANHGLHALAFKGPTLAAGVYGHLGRRVSGDVDLFIDRHDAVEIRRLLIAEGYRVRPPEPDRCESLLHGFFPAVGRDDDFCPGPRQRTAVDVHVAFAMWPFGIRCEARELFDRASAVDVAGHAIPTLCPADLLLVLAIHGTMHQWWPLRLVSDIDAVVDLIDDWDDVVARANAMRMRRMLWAALLVAQRLFGTILPPDVFARAARDSSAMQVARWAATRMFVLETPEVFWGRRPLLRSFIPDTLGQRLGFYPRGVVYRLLKAPWNSRTRPRERPAHDSRENAARH